MPVYFYAMKSKQKLITVAYAEDHLAVRKGIIANLEADESIKVTIEGNNGEELLANMLEANVLPDLCLIDINMPKMDGFKLIAEIKKRWPRMRCLVFTVFEFESYIIEMIKNGANGYLLKSCDPEELNVAVHSIYTDGYYYSETANSTAFSVVHNKKFKNSVFNDREIELLRYACTEMSYADIAAQMNTTFKTVDGIRERLCVKLGVTTRIGLALASIQLGYFTIKSSHFSK